MLKAVRILVGTMLVTGALTFVTATTATTAASDCSGWDCDGNTRPESGDGTIAITVTQTATGPGGTVSESSSGTSTAYIPPPCMYSQFMTGAEYYEYVESGEPYETANLTGEGSYEPYPNYEDYQDDTEGSWWTASCNSGRYADYFGFDHQEEFETFIDDFFDYSDEFFEGYEAIYVEPGDPVPVPDVEIPPEVLMIVAYDEMDLPDPEASWNPSRNGDAATFVNLDTWVWLESPSTLNVNATAGDNEATVTATLDTLTVSAPDATGATCAGAGIPWSADADEDAACQIVFNRSSANKPGQVTPVTTETNWTVTWSANGVAQGALDPQTLTAVTDVPVAEVQSIVTGG